MKKKLALTIALVMCIVCLSPYSSNASTKETLTPNEHNTPTKNKSQINIYDIDNYKIETLSDNLKERMVRVTDNTSGEIFENTYNKASQNIQTVLINKNGEKIEIFNSTKLLTLNSSEGAIEIDNLQKPVQISPLSSTLYDSGTSSMYNAKFKYYVYSGGIWVIQSEGSTKNPVKSSNNSYYLENFRSSVNNLRQAEIELISFGAGAISSWVVTLITSPTGWGGIIGSLTAIGLSSTAIAKAKQMHSIAGDCRYFFGSVLIGWVKVGGQWYYYDSYSTKRTGWLNSGGKWYYLDPNTGAMQTGWKYIGGKWYYLDYYNGVMKTGWLQYGSSWYYLDSSGAMQTGWKYIGGKWYYFDSSGAMKTGWLLDGGKWYYLDSSGAMKTGWQYIGGSYYYFYSDGSMAKNTTIDGYRIGLDGRRL
ncbi:geobacillin-26 family protein [Neobacillus thermocopriae]|uniref:geobacillin-26 family protein n=1 Tax=Neobacillus thermocopriae TaxID=1215031 RepID=UPI003770234A